MPFAGSVFQPGDYEMDYQSKFGQLQIKKELTQ